MSQKSRYLAFFAYVLSLPGALFVLLTQRDDPFAIFHARQSFGIALVGIVTPLVWAAVAWLLAWVPVIGGMAGVVLFALVLAIYAGLLACWVSGMIFALKGSARTVPVIGPRATRAQAAPTPPAEPSPAAEIV